MTDRPDGAEPPGILVTRPEPAATVLADELRTLGWRPFVSPVLTCRTVAPEGGLSPDGANAVIFTSANAIRSMPDVPDLRSLPAWCVGSDTAKSARVAGFRIAGTGRRDAEALAGLIAERCAPGSTFLHLRGSHGSDGLERVLRDRGMRLRSVVVYEMEQASSLASEASEALAAGKIRAATAFSPRSADALRRLTLAFDVSQVDVVAISEAAAQPLEGSGFRRLRVADSPDGEGMRRCIASLGALDGDA